MKRAKQEGVEAPKHRPPPDAQARLGEDERAKLYPSFWHEGHLLSWLEGSGWMPQALSSSGEEAPHVAAAHLLADRALIRSTAHRGVGHRNPHLSIRRPHLVHDATDRGAELSAILHPYAIGAMGDAGHQLPRKPRKRPSSSCANRLSRKFGLRAVTKGRCSPHPPPGSCS